MVHEIVLIVVGAVIVAVSVMAAYDAGMDRGIDLGSKWLMEVMIRDGVLNEERVMDELFERGDAK